MRVSIVFLSLGLCAVVGCGERVASMSDSGDAAPWSDAPNDAAQDALEDAAPDARSRNACELAGGMCVAAARSSSPPGFAFTCPDGFVSPNGTPRWIGPGSDLLTNGCPTGGGFEASLSGCCVPQRDP